MAQLIFSSEDHATVERGLHALDLDQEMAPWVRREVAGISQGRAHREHARP
jgi:hypothetical protein